MLRRFPRVVGFASSFTGKYRMPARAVEHARALADVTI
jgi:hypothetical protein